MLSLTIANDSNQSLQNQHRMSEKSQTASQISSHCHSSKIEPKEVFVFCLNLAISALRSGIEFIYENSAALVLTAVILAALYVLYKSYWSPLIYVKELTEVGFEHITNGKDRAMHITRSQSAKQLGNKLPPPYPNGWFAIAESRDLKIGKVLAVDALGLNLCVYRGEDGVARCVDAYCPHLGANLAIGGTVCGNCIQCPFHQWRFGSDGSCVSIPGVETVPKGISIKTWTTMELDGAVWLWYDAEGREPLWTVPEASETKNWSFRGRNEFMINAHIQEIPENGADIAHLNAIHSTSLLTSIGEKFPALHDIIGRHIWTATWSRDKDEHVATVDIVQKYLIMKFDAFPTKVKVKQIGPGHVRLRFDCPLGPVLISQSVTPMGALLQKVVNRIFSPAYNAPLAAFMVLAEAFQLKRDVAIWNSKRYVSAPAYVKTDKTIRAFRTWFLQFYSENSVPLRLALQNPLDW
ncbi:cholesterol 7-desaturase nvd [Battus philenor]|uniref:cholesterol 7-desaturase nvd n=1 Tax=Battus philenor TaxID=42288 RepID=UPI0035CF7023